MRNLWLKKEVLLTPCLGLSIASAAAAAAGGEAGEEVVSCISMNPLCWGLHQRAVAACFLISFVSLHGQVVALLGERGVFPAVESMAVMSAGGDEGAALLARFPTLFWFSPALCASDGGLLLAVRAGIGSAALATVGVGSRLPLLLAWALWLSLATVGHEFLAYPWDSLLLEAGALALLLPAPALWHAGTAAPPHRLARWASRLLAFRLMLGMGLHKFYFPASTPDDGRLGGGGGGLSLGGLGKEQFGGGGAWGAWRWLSGGAPCWLPGSGAPPPNGWTALTYLDSFYSWQPMPTPAARLAQAAGPLLHRASAVVVGVSQVLLPWAMFGPWWARAACCGAHVGEQAWIQLTGNFGVFNVLTAVLVTFPLLDDRTLLRLVPRSWRQAAARQPAPAPAAAAAAAAEAAEAAAAGAWERAVVGALGALSLVCGGFFICRCLVLCEEERAWLSAGLWLREDAASDALLAALPAWGAPLLAEPAVLAVVSLLRAAAPFRACNDYGIFRHGFTEATKPAVQLLGGGGAGGALEPLIFKTSQHQATGGATAPHQAGLSAAALHALQARSLPPWFAPHQPRLDHSFQYLGMELAIGDGEATIESQTVGEGRMDGREVLFATARALLREAAAATASGGGITGSAAAAAAAAAAAGPVHALFAHVPANLTRLYSRKLYCKFSVAGDDDQLVPGGSTWQVPCAAVGDDEAEGAVQDAADVAESDTDLTKFLGPELAVTGLRLRIQHLKGVVLAQRQLKQCAVPPVLLVALAVLGSMWLQRHQQHADSTASSVGITEKEKKKAE